RQRRAFRRPHCRRRHAGRRRGDGRHGRRIFEDDMKRYFTWAEANALVPRLAEIFGTVAQLRSQLRSTYEKLDALGFAPNGPNAGKKSDNPFVDRLRGLFQGFYETLTEQLRLVEELGAQVKDIDTG